MPDPDVVIPVVQKADRRTVAALERAGLSEDVRQATQYGVPGANQQLLHADFTAHVIAALAERVEELTSQVEELEERTRKRPRGRPPGADKRA